MLDWQFDHQSRPVPEWGIQAWQVVLLSCGINLRAAFERFMHTGLAGNMGSSDSPGVSAPAISREDFDREAKVAYPATADSRGRARVSWKGKPSNLRSTTCHKVETCSVGGGQT